MQHLKQELEKDCQAIQQQKMELTDTLNTLQQGFDASAEKYQLIQAEMLVATVVATCKETKYFKRNNGV